MFSSKLLLSPTFIAQLSFNSYNRDFLYFSYWSAYFSILSFISAIAFFFIFPRSLIRSLISFILLRTSITCSLASITMSRIPVFTTFIHWVLEGPCNSPHISSFKNSNFAAFTCPSSPSNFLFSSCICSFKSDTFVSNNS